MQQPLLTSAEVCAYLDTADDSQSCQVVPYLMAVHALLITSLSAGTSFCVSENGYRTLQAVLAVCCVVLGKHIFSKQKQG